jgi:hypothetical protein
MKSSLLVCPLICFLYPYRPCLLFCSISHCVSTRLALYLILCLYPTFLILYLTAYSYISYHLPKYITVDISSSFVLSLLIFYLGFFFTFLSGSVFPNKCFSDSSSLLLQIHLFFAHFPFLDSKKHCARAWTNKSFILYNLSLFLPNIFGFQICLVFHNVEYSENLSGTTL